jgi:hypothetical protein
MADAVAVKILPAPPGVAQLRTLIRPQPPIQ